MLSYCRFHSHLPHVFSGCKTSIIVIFSLKSDYSQYQVEIKLRIENILLLLLLSFDRQIRDLGNENDNGHKVLSFDTFSKGGGGGGGGCYKPTTKKISSLDRLYISILLLLSPTPASKPRLALSDQQQLGQRGVLPTCLSRPRCKAQSKA